MPKKKRRQKAGEEWARRIVEKELKRTVVINDDGSAPGMYDLRVGTADGPELVVECVGAVDSTFTETWNMGPAKGPLQLPVRGNWIVEIEPITKLNTLRQHLGRVLKDLDGRGAHNLSVDHWLQRSDAALFDELTALGITHVICYEPSGGGKVHLTLPGTGGAVDGDGSALPGWVGDFLRDPTRQDVLRKLQRAPAPERHVFVIVTFVGAPWLVESYLTGDLDRVPVQAPNLPPPVTGVWVVAGGGRRGVRWSDNVWKLFDARGAGIDISPAGVS